ncbi:succinate dehydrogenase assembly factor 2 [Uliginosibacterium sp. H3]|uniref:FAD assembly factor SdhE n=1 Tax=Uliginosibacterium silvisoli TaxID=3114758 RepID=A0ABU6K8Z7_9RHOO|nr:succinate dehydrogenase assembly factor 2 [Uliginosibacterium sp. H3]
MYVLREKIKWRARRGLLELDLFFTRFIANDLDALSEPELENLLDLLTCDDHELWAMLSGKEECEVPHWQSTVALLKRSAPDIANTSL